MTLAAEDVKKLRQSIKKADRIHIAIPWESRDRIPLRVWMCSCSHKTGSPTVELHDAAWRYHPTENAFEIDEWNPIEMENEDCYTQLPYDLIKSIELSKRVSGEHYEVIARLSFLPGRLVHQ